MIRLFSAFAGYGTDNFALKKLGIPFECVGFSEIDKYAIQCFIQNHCKIVNEDYNGTKQYEPVNYGDISKINWEEMQDFDLLTGGFPCQDVSVAGRQDLNKGRTILGMELTKALKIKQPKYFVFENVRGLMSKKFDKFREQLIKSWEDCGYKIYFEVLNTKDFGIPQSRPRVFFVGIRKDIEQDFKFPEKEELKVFIENILEKDVDKRYNLSEKQINSLMNGLQKSKINPKIANPIQCPGHSSGNYKGMNIFALRSYSRTNNPERDKEIGRFQNMEVRQDGCSNSLTGVEKDNMVFIDIYNKKVQDLSPALTNPNHNSLRVFDGVFRRLTPKECFRLQGFLDDGINLEGLSDTQAYKLAGNGQSLNVVTKIFKQLNSEGKFFSSQP